MIDRFLIPLLFKDHITAFFTDKKSGAEPDDISRILKIHKDKIFMPLQKHTDKIIIVESSLEPRIADAVITKEKGILIGVRTADCVPVLLHDKKKNVFGAVHAGWRGTAEGIIKKTVSVMIERYVSDPDDIFIAIGPAIRWCCYAVGQDVLERVKGATGEGEYFISKQGKNCLDLPSANKYQALQYGVPEKNIWMSEECTFCNPEKFYSYRYAKGQTGRQGGFIGMLE
jgi:polyphenol oxidase